MDPFAPSTPSTTEGPPCPGCSRPHDPGSAGFDGSGRLVCRACLAAQTVAAADQTLRQAEADERHERQRVRSGWLMTAVFGAAAPVLVVVGLLVRLVSSGVGSFVMLAGVVSFIVAVRLLIRLLIGAGARALR